MEFAEISPLIVLALGGTFLFLFDAFGGWRERRLLPALSLVTLLVTGVFIWLFWPSMRLPFGGMLLVDDFSRYFATIAIIGSFLALCVVDTSLREQEAWHGEVFPLFIFSTLGMLLLLSSANLVMVFMGMEVMSIPLYILAASRRESDRSVEAGAKYFLMGAFASGFLLYGIALVYGATGSLGLFAISEAWKAGAGTSLVGICGMLLIFVGLAFKIAAVPFHMWEPDAYEGAPTAITAFFAAGPKIAGFAILLRLVGWVFPLSDPFVWPFMWVLAALSMTVGNFLAITQSSVKRMLAYSGIAHAGYALIGVTVGGIEAVGLVGYYLLGYFLAASGAFIVVAALEKSQERSLTYEDCAGRAKTQPALSLALTIFMVSLAGIPPVAGFVGKFYIFESALENGLVWLVIIAAVNSIVSVYYYLRAPVFCFMKDSETTPERPTITVGLSFAIVVAVIGLLVVGIAPEIFIDLANATTLWMP